MASYDDRKKQHQNIILKEASNKHNFLTKAFLQSEIDEATLFNCCETVRKHGNNADFTLIKLIRFVYLDNDNLVSYQDQVLDILSHFSFWPSKTKSALNSSADAVGKTCFWSENHIFMYLSSCHLYAQKCVKKDTNYQYEQHLLLIYLNAHCDMQGVYEVNSAVYLPYTLASLLNLYDFSPVQDIRDKALFIIDKILTSALLVCNVDGICTLPASARQSPRNIFRNYDHNINQVWHSTTPFFVISVHYFSS